jgi:phosphatidylserine decarboxylase
VSGARITQEQATWRALGEARLILIPLLILDAGATVLATRAPAWFAVSAVMVLLFVAVCLFFRNPARTVPVDAHAIVAPADGRVDVVSEVAHHEALGGPARRVSIFLSVLDVHLNRAPCAGVVRSVRHERGEFLDARRPECAVRNENVLWVIDTPRGRVGMRQIAGLIARRIVTWKDEGDPIATGEHVGLIRFGSRTELYLPMSCEVVVRPGDRVRGAESVVARWPE